MPMLHFLQRKPDKRLSRWSWYFRDHARRSSWMCSIVNGEGRATAQSPSIVKDFRALCQPCVSPRESKNKDASVLRRQCAGPSQVNKKHFELTDPIEPLRLGWNWPVRLSPEEVLQIHVLINYSTCAIIVPYWSPCLVYSGSVAKCFLKQEYSPSPSPASLRLPTSCLTLWYQSGELLGPRCDIAVPFHMIICHGWGQPEDRTTEEDEGVGGNLGGPPRGVTQGLSSEWWTFTPSGIHRF